MAFHKLYIVAGERNMSAAQVLGGLYANVGMTTRTVYDRLRDRDYRRKQSSGKWRVILEDKNIGNYLDEHVHRILKQRDDVKWDPESPNTEEFLFINDPGDGSIATKIILECLESLSTESIDAISLDTHNHFEQRLKQSGTPRISNFTHKGIYWFKVKNSFVRKTQRGAPYIVVKFIDNTGTHNGMFVWNTMTTLAPGSIWVAEVYECRKGIAVRSNKLRRVVVNTEDKMIKTENTLAAKYNDYKKKEKLNCQNNNSQIKNEITKPTMNAKVEQKTNKRDFNIDFFILIVSLGAIIYLFDFILK
jgi:hypothetical protein